MAGSVCGSGVLALQQDIVVVQNGCWGKVIGKVGKCQYVSRLLCCVAAGHKIVQKSTFSHYYDIDK